MKSPKKYTTINTEKGFSISVATVIFQRTRTSFKVALKSTEANYYKNLEAVLNCLGKVMGGLQLEKSTKKLQPKLREEKQGTKGSVASLASSYF